MQFKVPARRGGARAGAGRKPGSLTVTRGRFLYVMHEADDPNACKVGVANNPSNRLGGHQVSTWRRLVLSSVVTCPTAAEAFLLERAVHKNLRGRHILGEWFEVSPEKARTEVFETAKAHSISIEDFDASHLKTIKSVQDDSRR